MTTINIIVIIIIVIVVILLSILAWYYLRPKNVDNGGSCYYDADCTSNACGRLQAGTNAPLSCCPSGSTDLFGGYYYCTEMPNGTSCYSDAMCANGYCADDEDPAAYPGFCTGNAKVGELCSIDSNCQNNACGRPSASTDATPVCCPSGAITLYGGYYYCTKLSAGTSCYSDSMCASGLCEDGVCANLLPNDAVCTSSDQCANDNCGLHDAAVDAKYVCCNSNSSSLYNSHRYCDGLENGGTCFTDYMCKSGYCEGDVGGTQRGRCRSG